MKQGDLSAVWKHSRIYGLSNVLNRLAALILLPVYLHVLDPAEFGILALVMLTTDIVGVVLGLGLGRALLRFYVAADTGERRDRLVVSSLALLVGLGACFAALAEPAAKLMCLLLFSHSEHVPIFAYANLAIVFTVLFNFELSCLIARKASSTYFWASLAKTLLLLSLNGFLVVQAELGILGVVLGTLLSSVILAGALLIELLRGRRLRISLRIIGELVRFAAPLVPSVLIDTAVAALDKLALNRLDSPAAVGGYSTGQRVSGLLQMFIAQPFMQIWAVRQLEALAREEVEERASLSRVFSLFVIVLCAGALFVSLFAGEILAVIAAPEYADAAELIPLLALAEVLLLFRSYFELGVLHAGATRYLPWVSLITLTIALPVYAGLVGGWGVTGAASAFLLIAGFRVAAVAVVAHRVSPVGTDLDGFGCAVAIGGAALAFMVTDSGMSGEATLVTGGLKVAVVAAYTSLMFFSPVVGADARSEILQLVRRARTPARIAPVRDQDAGRSS